jgi:hypothetical protein
MFRTFNILTQEMRNLSKGIIVKTFRLTILAFVMFLVSKRNIKDYADENIVPV